MSSELNDKLIKILLRDENDKEFKIVFFKVAGEKSTYKIIGDSIEIFGDVASRDDDFLNLIQMF